MLPRHDIFGLQFHTNPLKLFWGVGPKKFRGFCMELSVHNWANISETIWPEMLIFGLLDVVLSEYLDESHNSEI